jgi:hypothetical protein
VDLPFPAAYYLCVWISSFITLIGGMVMLVADGWTALQIGRDGNGRTSTTQKKGAPALGEPPRNAWAFATSET